MQDKLAGALESIPPPNMLQMEPLNFRGDKGLSNQGGEGEELPTKKTMMETTLYSCPKDELTAQLKETRDPILKANM